MICIDISGEHIDIVVTKGSKNNLSIDSGKTLNLPSNVFFANGDINFSVLEEALSETLASLSEKKVVMSFSFLPTVYSVLNLHVERSRKEQRMAVESQVYANISPDSYYVDYFEAENSQTVDNKQDYVSYALPKNVVDGSFEMLKKLGKIPVALVPAQHAAESFIDTFFPQRVVSLAKLGEKNITLHLLNPPNNMITRNAVLDTSNNSLDILASMGSSVNPETVFVQNVEKLNSYQSIKFSGKPIEQILIFGHNINDELVTLVNSTVGVPCALLSNLHENFNICPAVYTLGAALSLGQNEINFYRIDRTEKSKKVKKPLNIPLLVALLIIIANIGVILVLSSTELQINNLISQKEAELSSPETVALLEKYGGLREDYVARLKSDSALSSLAAEIEKLGEFDRAILNSTVAAAPEGITVSSFSYSGHTYNISCSGQTEQQAADYVEALTGLNIYSFVGYYGFTDSGEQVTFTVTGEL